MSIPETTLALRRFHQWQRKAGGSPNRCGPFAIAIAANILLANAQHDGDEIAERLKARWLEFTPLPRLNRFPPDDATLPGAMVRELRCIGLNARLHGFGKFDAMCSALDAGHLALPIHGQWTHRVGLRWWPWAHVFVAVGHTDAALLAVDPGTPDAAVVAYPLQTWLNHWRSMGRLWIEVSRKPQERPAG